MLISSLPRRKIICGFNPPRAAIQRRTGDGYIEYSVCGDCEDIKPVHCPLPCEAYR